MLRGVVRVRLALVVFLAACSSQDPQVTPPGPSSSLAATARISATQVVTPPDPYACRTDGDCRTSCKWGAVSRTWYDASPRSECEDGCESKGLTSACRTGACVTLDRDGKLLESCTKRVEATSP